MKVGDLVKFVGYANFYKGRIGVVCRLYSTHAAAMNGRPVPPNSALVYYPGAEFQGRALPRTSAGTPLRHHKSGLHPMALDEREAIE